MTNFFSKIRLDEDCPKTDHSRKLLRENLKHPNEYVGPHTLHMVTMLGLGDEPQMYGEVESKRMPWPNVALPGHKGLKKVKMH